MLSVVTVYGATAAMSDDTRPTGAPVLFDPAMLDGLRAALGPAVDGLVAKATGILEERLTRLEALRGDPLSDATARLAHEIGGVAGQIGLSRLSHEALALERLCRGEDAGAAADAAVQIGDTARRSLAAVREP